MFTIFAGALSPAKGDLTLFSPLPTTAVPETISSIPTSFNPAGGYLVPDPGPATADPTGSSIIWDIPQGGGNPTEFATVPDQLRAGLFLPASFATYGGDYLAAGVQTVYALNASGNISTVASDSSYPYYSGLAIAPTGFGSAAGDVLIVTQQGPSGGGILDLSATTDQLSTFVPSLTNLSSPFGMVFAPSSFGAVGGQLLVSDSRSGVIDAVSSSGAVSVFTTLTLGPDQTGLRQMAFAPAGFGFAGLDLSGDLIVSVSGSNLGHGVFGAVEAVNSLGQVVATLVLGSQANAFDPRGLDFASSTQLLISNADPGIVSASPSNFSAVPEPATWVLLTLPLLAGLGCAPRSRRR